VSQPLGNPPQRLSALGVMMAKKPKPTKKGGKGC
jgi:hypothetical protein